MKSEIVKYFFIFITISCTVYLCFGDMDRSIDLRDEVIHSIVAQGLAFHDESFFRPRYFDGYYLQKPPLQIWGTALLLKVLGDQNFVYRILPGVFGMGTITLLIYSGTVFFSDIWIGILASLLFLGGRYTLFEHGIKTGVQDSALLFGSTLSILCAWLLIKEKAKIWPPIGITLGLVIGTMVKWVSGLVALIVYCSLLLTKENRDSLKKYIRPLLLGIIAGGIPVVTYLGIYYMVDPGTIMSEVFGSLHTRLLGEGYHNQERFDIYLRSIFTRRDFATPKLLIPGLISSFFFFNKNRSACAYLFFWWLCPLVVFSFLSSRLIWYYLPAVPGLLLAAAFGLVSLWNLILSKNRIAGYTCILAVLLTALFNIYKNTKLVKAENLVVIDTFTTNIINSENKSIELININPRVRGPKCISRREVFYVRRLHRLKVNNGQADLKFAFIEKGSPSLKNELYKYKQCVRTESCKSYAFCAYSKFKLPDIKQTPKKRKKKK